MPNVEVRSRFAPHFKDPSLREMLEKRGVELIEQDTAQAVCVFNRLWQEERNVSAGFHLTC